MFTDDQAAAKTAEQQSTSTSGVHGTVREEHSRERIMSPDRSVQFDSGTENRAIPRSGSGSQQPYTSDYYIFRPLCILILLSHNC